MTEHRPALNIGIPYIKVADATDDDAARQHMTRALAAIQALADATSDGLRNAADPEASWADTHEELKSDVTHILDVLDPLDPADAALLADPGRRYPPGSADPVPGPLAEIVLDRHWVPDSVVVKHGDQLKSCTVTSAAYLDLPTDASVEERIAAAFAMCGYRWNGHNATITKGP